MFGDILGLARSMPLRYEKRQFISKNYHNTTGLLENYVQVYLIITLYLGSIEGDRVISETVL